MDAAPVDDPAILSGLGAVIPADFQAKLVVPYGARDDVSRNMRRVLPVVADWGLRQLGGRRAMRVRDRPERGIPRRGVVELYDGGPDRPRVLNTQIHHKVVRVLRVDKRLPVRRLAGLE